MNEITADIIVWWYKEIEGQLVDFLSHVPYHEQNKNVFSPKLADIITNCCGILDSIFKYITPDNIVFYDGTKKKKGRDNLNINDYAELFGFRLASFKAILLLSPVDYILPYSCWDIPGIARDSAPSPSWWQVHNDIKHDRLNNLIKANLDNAINSISALFILIATQLEFLKAILRAGWVNYEHAIQVIYKWAQDGYPTGGISVVMKTILFALPLGRPMPDSMSDLHAQSFMGGQVLMPYINPLT